MAVEEAAVSPATEKAPPKSSGILGTPITWEIVEKDFQDHFGTTAKIGEGRSSHPIGEGNGFMSKLALVKFDWTEKSEELPETAVVKITGFGQLKEMCETVLNRKFEDVKKQSQNIHNNELAAYQMLRDDWKLTEDVLKTPKFYVGRKFDEGELEAGYIVLEHIEGGTLRHIYHTVQTSAVVEALKIVAKMGAISLKRPDFGKHFQNNFFMTTLAEFFQVEPIRMGLPAALVHLPDCEKQVEIVLAKLDKVISLEAYQSLVAESCPVPMLCHGDMWSANIIWDKDAHGDFHLKTLIDWQLARVGSPIEDLTRLLLCVVTTEEKKKNLSFFLKAYYTTLRDECGDEVDVPFTFEKLVEMYEKFLPLVVVPFVPMMAPFMDMLLAGVPEDEKEAAREVFVDKVRGMLMEATEYIEKWY